MAVSTTLVTLGTTVAIFAILAIGLNVKFGYTGLLEIGHVAFFLLGGYLAALFVLPPAASGGNVYLFGLNLPWIVAIPLAGLVTGVFGAMFSLPAIRLREDYLAITLLGMAYIVQQLFRSERWLANGPRALAGYELPLVEVFPLPGESLASVLMLGVVVWFLWLIATVLLAQYEFERDDGDVRARLLAGAYAVTLLGVGYLAARRAADADHSTRLRYGALAGLVVGAVTAGATVAIPGPTMMLLVLGLYSVWTWVFGTRQLLAYYDVLTRRDWLVGFGLAVAFLVSFGPLVVLGTTGDEVLATVGALATLALLGVYIWGVYYLGTHWDRYGDGAGLIRIIGVGAAWVFLARYFVLSSIGPARQGVVVMLFNVFENVVWLVKFDPNIGITFGYARFLFVATLATLAAIYYLAEVTVASPFGRVLKAIREDEDVARALGKNTFSYKVQSMALGSAIGGIAGAFQALQSQALTWSTFRIEITFIALVMVIIGGTANNRGAILGAAIFWAFSKGTSDLVEFFPAAAGSSAPALRRVVIGLLLIVILYYRPEGLWGEESEVMEVTEQ